MATRTSSYQKNTNEWTYQRASSPIHFRPSYAPEYDEAHYIKFVDNLHKLRVGHVRGATKPLPGIFSGHIVFTLQNNVDQEGKRKV